MLCGFLSNLRCSVEMALQHEAHFLSGVMKAKALFLGNLFRRKALVVVSGKPAPSSNATGNADPSAIEQEETSNAESNQANGTIDDDAGSYERDEW